MLPVSKETVYDAVATAHVLRPSKTLFMATDSIVSAHDVLETMLFSDEVILQFSDDEPVEW